MRKQRTSANLTTHAIGCCCTNTCSKRRQGARSQDARRWWGCVKWAHRKETHGIAWDAHGSNNKGQEQVCVCVCVCVCVSRAQLACCHKPMNANALTQPHIQSRGSNNSNPSRPNSFTQQPTQAYSQEDRSLESHQRAALRPSRVKVGTQFRGCASCAFYFACAAVHTATHSTGCEECVRTFARAVSNCLALYATVPASLASAAFALFS
jgi:hypothetical protein